MKNLDKDGLDGGDIAPLRDGKKGVLLGCSDF
jgi:hypothetical protein